MKGVEMENERQKLVLFGASRGGSIGYKHYKKDFDIVCFLDNDRKKVGKKKFGKKIYDPSDLSHLDFDRIAVCSMYFNDIFYQLKSMGVDTQKIECISPQLLENDLSIGEIILLLLSVSLLGMFGVFFFWLIYEALSYFLSHF